MSTPALLEKPAWYARRIGTEVNVQSAWLLALVAIGALGVVAGVLIIDAAPVGVFADDAMYVILARSLASGLGLRVLNLPGEPLAGHFPPGYPLVLAVLWRLAPSFPDNVMVFKAFNAVCLGAAAVGIARYVRIRVGRPVLGLVVGAATAVSVPLFFLGTMVISELFFLALLVFLLPALERFGEERASIRNAVVLGVAIGCCALVRTHGVVLAPAMAFVLVTRGRWRDAGVVMASTIVTMLPWQLWSAAQAAALPAPLAGTYGSYGAWWHRGFETFGPSIFSRTLAKTLPETYGVFAVTFSALQTYSGVVVTALLLVTAIGTAVRVHWNRIAVTLMFLLGYFLILELWPGPPTRMIWGLWPLLLMVIAVGCDALIRATPYRPVAVRVLAACVALWLATGYARYEWSGIRGQWWAILPAEAGAQMRGMVAWTRKYTKPDDVIATDLEGAVYLYTGRHTVPVRTFTADQYLSDPTPAVEVERGLAPLLAAYPVRAVVVASPGSFATAQLLTIPPRRLLSGGPQYPWGATFTVLRP